MATELNLTGDNAIYAGDDYAILLTLTDPAGGPLDVAGYTFRAQLRRNQVSSTAYDFAVTVDNTAGPGDPTTVLLALTDEQTAAMPGDACPTVWDLEVTVDDGGPLEWTETWFDGAVDVERDVTRPAAP